ncbi:MAG: HAD family hydrolase, partial [Deltaproteobacteria bacterium]|nr:HAD family hydrolase [Deltaproteobacteria bacterium]
GLAAAKAISNGRARSREHAVEIARKHGFDATPPDLVPGIEASLKATQDAGLANILMTTGGRRYKHQAMEEHGLGEYFEEIIDRDETYFTKEQGIYHLFRKRGLDEMRVILLSGTASYIRAGNNLEKLKVGRSRLEVFTAALATEFSYSDEETLLSAKPKILIRSLDELFPSLLEAGFISP